MIKKGYSFLQRERNKEICTAILRTTSAIPHLFLIPATIAGINQRPVMNGSESAVIVSYPDFKEQP